MKAIILIFMLGFINGFAQDDLEQRDDSFILENNKNLLKIDIKIPFNQIKAKGCQNFEPASFEGGAKAYKQLLSDNMFKFLNSDFYTINGEFTFTLKIDEKGKVYDAEGNPKVMNSNIFFDDMQYVVRRIKNNWTPAKCNNVPVSSEMNIQMNFKSIATDL